MTFVRCNCKLCFYATKKMRKKITEELEKKESQHFSCVSCTTSNPHFFRMALILVTKKNNIKF